MKYYWIRKEDYAGQEIIDEAEIDSKVCFIKVKDTLGAIAYHEEQYSPIAKEEALPV